jgi:hypothetical protein
MTTSFRGALSREPGIHNPEPWLWIPGLRQEAHPGMTALNNKEKNS